MDKLVLIGAGGHCKVIIDMVKRNYEIVGITDTDPAKHNKKFYGIDVIGNDDILRYIYNKGVEKALISLGSVKNNLCRERLFDAVRSIGFEMVNAVSSRAIVSDSVRLGQGNVVMDGAIVHADTVIGNNVIVNTNSLVEHDCIIKDHVHISIGAKIAGGVKIGRGSFIGMGTSIIQGVSIGERCIIGAGAVVLEDVPDNSVCIGVPARIIKQVD